MIEDAEKNAALDRAKRSLVNITYEFDNLLNKIEKFNNTDILENSETKKYFNQILKRIKVNYKTNNFKEIYLNDLELLQKSYSYLVLESTKNSLPKSPNDNSGKGVVIDVTEE